MPGRVCVSRGMLGLVLLGWPALVGSLARGAEAARPNVVVILTDDQGWGDLSLNRNTNLRTPRVDSLARDGARFERFYVCPVCSPTRAEFLTGRYHPRGGVRDVSRGGERLDLDETTIAQRFQAAGYVTAAFGKWHNGSQYPYHPRARGFGEFYGFTSGHWGDYFDPPLEHDGRIVRGRGFIADDLTDHAVAFLEANRDQPFFCYLPFNTPHSPMQVPDRDWERLKQAPLPMRLEGPVREDLENTRAALAMCENIDRNVGRVLDALEKLKLAEHTVVVYFCDNGPAAPRWNGGMRGRKGTTDEGGVRSPLLIRWPGRIAAGLVVAPIAGAIDLLPTLLDLAGLPTAPAPGHPFDGQSLAPLLLGGPAPATLGDRLIFSHWNGRVSVRTQQYRLDDTGRLYDMTTDPGQSRDVAADRPEIAARLRQAVRTWRADVLAGLGPDDRPFPVGHAAWPVTFLPARDGVPSGRVHRGAPAPNCSYFTGWISPDDRMTWDVEVLNAGRYEAVLYYTCAPADIGSTIELAWNGHRIQSRIDRPHDPPARGAEHDRVPRRGESLVKDFEPLTLGAFELPTGRGKLTLRALQIPGKAVAEVRLIELRRKAE